MCHFLEAIILIMKGNHTVRFTIMLHGELCVQAARNQWLGSVSLQWARNSTLSILPVLSA